MTQEPITCAETAPKTSPENGRPQDPPDYLWIVTDETGNPFFETMEGRQYMRLYETPEEAGAAPRMPGRALLCRVIVRRLKATDAVYRKDEGRGCGRRSPWIPAASGSNISTGFMAAARGAR